jgi:NTP pyrophosphatase (non-canonical NTP hydrolase)
MHDNTTTIQQLKDSVERFKLDRNWGRYHTPQDLAVSISIEAAELLEVFQWGIKEDVDPEKVEKIKEELADVLIYSLSLANTLELDVATIVRDKIKRNAEKYPVELAMGKAKKYDEL